jgi:hypothetical protein
MSVATVEAKPISERKMAANRANAQKSTGPRTAEGKARVSQNAVIHGLRSEMIVLPNEDPAEFEAMRDGFFEDWKPPTETRRVLVERVAAGAWRLRRCVKLERDRIAEQVQEAVAAYDARVKARMDEGVRLLPIQPARAIEIFHAEHAGVFGLTRLWKALGLVAADPKAWNEPFHHIRLLNLYGQPGDADANSADLGPAAMLSWRLFVWNRPELGDCDEPIANDTEAAEVAEDLAAIIAWKVGKLEIDLTQFPDPQLVREQIADAASFDVSREGIALQRYEGQLDRAFRSNLNQLIKLTQTGIDLTEDAPSPTDAPNKPTEPVVAHAPNKPTEPVAVVAHAPNKPTEPVAVVSETPNKPTDHTPSDPSNLPPMTASELFLMRGY